MLMLNTQLLKVEFQSGLTFDVQAWLMPFFYAASFKIIKTIQNVINLLVFVHLLKKIKMH